jgi:RNA polymerase sigma-70 factor (ECF subfamily)
LTAAVVTAFAPRGASARRAWRVLSRSGAADWDISSLAGDGRGQSGERLLGGQRSEREFERIVRATEAQIRAYVAAMGIGPDEVDDLAQEVFIALYRNMDAWPEGVALMRWLKGIARNLSMNHFRKQSRRAHRQREAIAVLLTQAREAWEVEEAGAPQDALESCLKKLSRGNRELIALRYEQGLGSQAIGEAVDKSPEAVRVKLHRIRATLKDCIARSLSRTA